MRHLLASAAMVLFSIQLSLAVISAPAAAESTTITLDRAVHFQAAAGGNVVASPDDYMVIGVEEGRLLLVPEKGKVPLVITADTSRHEETISNPVARAASTGTDEHRILLLLPNGERREAIGTYSGTKRPLPAVAAAPQPGTIAVTPPVTVPAPSSPVASSPNFAFNGPTPQPMPRSGIVPEHSSALSIDQQILLGIQRLESKIQAIEQRMSALESKLDAKFLGGGLR